MQIAPLSYENLTAVARERARLAFAFFVLSSLCYLLAMWFSGLAPMGFMLQAGCLVTSLGLIVISLIAAISTRKFSFLGYTLIGCLLAMIPTIAALVLTAH